MVGSRGTEVKKVQALLKVEPDGIYGPMTRAAVVKFQLSKEIKPTGIVDSATWAELFHSSQKVDDIDQDSDVNGMVYITDFNQEISRYYLPEKEYVHETYNNQYVVLHHTASGPNPFNVIDLWGRDNRGRIGTEFVLGGQDHVTGNDEYDGKMVQAFPQGNLAWHIGKSGSGYMNKRSVGLEICSIGYLDNDKRSYVNRVAKEDQIITLSKPFKGFLYWHNYSDTQLEEIEKWIKYVADRDNIDVRQGLQQLIKKYGPTKAFDFHQEAYEGKMRGLLSHGNIRTDKTDVYPHPGLVEIIANL